MRLGVVMGIALVLFAIDSVARTAETEVVDKNIELLPYGHELCSKCNSLRKVEFEDWSDRKAIIWSMLPPKTGRWMWQFKNGDWANCEHEWGDFSRALPKKVADGKVVLICQGGVYGGFILTGQERRESTMYTWCYGTNESGVFDIDHPAVKASTSPQPYNMRSLGLTFGPFGPIMWSDDAEGPGYLYYPTVPGDEAAESLAMCVTGETSFDGINPRDSKWEYKRHRFDTPMPGGKIQETLSWGERVEGVRCRLFADKPEWKVGQIPTLKLDLKNEGDCKLTYARTQQVCGLYVDGQLYRYQEIIAAYSPFPPGKRYEPIVVTLDHQWINQKNCIDPLRLLPGKHSIKVMIKLYDYPHKDQIGGSIDAVQVISNPVEIEVLPAKTPSTQVQMKKSVPSDLDVAADIVANWIKQGEMQEAIVDFRGPVNYGECLPIDCKTKVVEIFFAKVSLHRDEIRARVLYRFVDGRSDGDVLFKFSFLDGLGKLIDSQTHSEARIRDIPAIGYGQFKREKDKPNREGYVGFKFDVSRVNEIAEFRLEVLD